MFLKLYAVALPVFLILDLAWLGMSKRFYARQLGSLMAPSPFWPPAALFYLLFVAGLVVFVMGPAMEKHSTMHAVAYGALFGLVSYATYDLTNLSTIKDWPLSVTIVDLAWGTAVAALASMITVLIAIRNGW